MSLYNTIGKEDLQLMNRKEYSAGAVKHSFWFMEFRKVVSLLAEGKTFDEIKQLNKSFPNCGTIGTA